MASRKQSCVRVGRRAPPKRPANRMTPHQPHTIGAEETSPAALFLDAESADRAWQRGRGPDSPKSLDGGSKSPIQFPIPRVPTLRRPRCRDRRQAHYRPGRAYPWPGGNRTRRTTYEVSWTHRILQSLRPALPGRTVLPIHPTRGVICQESGALGHCARGFGCASLSPSRRSPRGRSMEENLMTLEVDRNRAPGSVDGPRSRDAARAKLRGRLFSTGP